MNMIDGPLWLPTNDTLFSRPFPVPVGKVGILYADGLKEQKYRTSAEDFEGPQAVCVRRLRFKYSPGEKPVGSCSMPGDIRNEAVPEEMNMILRTCGNPWQLTKCKNVGIIGLPGSYILELNDATAIREAQVYLELVPARALPDQIANLFF